VLRDFWQQFAADVAETNDLRVTEVLEALNELLGPHIFPARAEGGDPRLCPSCGSGRLSLKLGKFGAFVGCSNYPECRYTRQLAVAGDGANGSEIGGDGTRILGVDPDTGLEVSLRSGRFGPYVQLGEAGEDGTKPKRSSLPRGWEAATLELAEALALLGLPREVGTHPETGTPITAGIGRYGPFVQHDGTFANLDSVEEVFSVGLNRAVSVLAEKRAGGGRPGGRAAPKSLKALGDHPSEGGAITIRDGRYGPYVNHGKINATLPKDVSPESVTMEQALEFLSAKAGKGPSKRPARTAAKKPPAKAKKPAARKPAAGTAKKSAAKKG
jgi:DNA topoisomerase-1